jgi:deoxycytidylate deaminase
MRSVSSFSGPCYDGIDLDICKEMNFEQKQYMDKCLDLAHKSTLTQKHGCVIVRRKKIISCGYNFKIQNHFEGNKKTSASSSCSYDNHKCKNSDIFSVHAEISTLKKVKNQDLTGCDLYVARLGPNCTLKNKNEPMKYSLPCKVCNSYIQLCGIKKVYYSINPQK